MALERLLETSMLNSHYFDDMFNEVNREIARMHQDCRSAMLRLTPPDPISEGSAELNERLELFKNPIDGKDFQLQFDVSPFKPNEIKVKTDGKEISVDAKHVDENEHSRVFHHFSRHYTIPEGVDADALSSTLSKDGVLTIKAPVSADNALEQAEEPPAKKQKEDTE